MVERVSVVIATYNGEKYIKDQIDSILAQTYSVFEIIIKDDCSTDHTIEIVQEYQKKYSNIRLLCNKKNVGVWTNFLEGFYLANGELIAYCDQDDIWLPNRMERMLPYMKGRNLVYCNSSVCDENGRTLYHLRDGKRVFVTELMSILDLQVWGHQMLFRKEILYKEDVQRLYRYISLDSLLPIIAFQGDNSNVHYLNENLVCWRRSCDSYTGIYNAMLPVGLEAVLNVFRALVSLCDENKINVTKKFFTQILTLNGLSGESKKMATLMAAPSLFNLIHSSFICLKDCAKRHQDLILKEKVRICLKPLLTIRVQFKYIAE